MNKNILQTLFLFCFSLCAVGNLSAQVTFTSALPDSIITVSCDAIPPPAILTAEGCLAIAPFAFINEIHYDNAGDDVGEFIEVAGPAGTDLSNYSIVLYNGSNSMPYNTIDLTGTIDDEGTGFGAVDFQLPSNGLQNGEPDGLALIFNEVDVVEFLSYEGTIANPTITAIGGPADGMTSTALIVSEAGGAPVGQSLQRIDTVATCSAADFQFFGPIDATPGTLNSFQSFQASACPGSTEAIVTLEETTAPGTCPGESIIVRTFTATDGCGDSAQFIQVIILEDTTPPTFINPPADLALDCGDIVPDAEVLLASDNCSFGDATPGVFINEFHYDNTGGDVGEFIEVAGTAGFDLTGYSIVLYNGNNQQTYGITMNLTGTIGNEYSGFGAVSYPYPSNGIQNGAPDGIALVDDLGEVIQFISYEGSFTANGGPADSLTSMDVGVLEPGSDMTGMSLQLTGTGAAAADFTWSGPTAESPGMLNEDQNFGTLTATLEETMTGTALCGSIVRTFTADDGCGNIATLVQTISISDATAPEVTCPPNQNLSCFENTPNPATTAAEFIAMGGMLSDDCTDLDDLSVIGEVSSNGGDNCPSNGNFTTIDYLITDACGNSSACQQTFTYTTSTQGPVITSVLPTCFKFCADQANPMTSDITFDTDCAFEGDVNITGPTVMGPDNCPGTTYRYAYTVTDACDRTSAPVFRDFVIGNDGPTITCAPFNLILDCGDPNNQDYIDTYLDQITVTTSCGLGSTLNSFPSNFNLISCGSSTEVTFVVTDDCGRTASCQTTVAIQDVTAPEFTFEPTLSCDVIECGADAQFFFEKFIASNIDSLEATDNCDTNVSISAINPQLNQTCNADGEAITVVTFAATDDCNNSSTFTRTFTIRNTAPALFGNVAPDATVECTGGTPDFGPAPTVTEQCQTTVTSMDTVDDSDPCAIVYTRTYTATDACGGLTTSVSQTITVIDTQAPQPIAAPADLNLQCASEVPVEVMLTAFDNCQGDVTVASADVITPGSCENQFSIERTWTFTDLCGNSSSAIQNINVNDNTNPTFTFVPAGGTVACGDAPAFGTATATDNCGTVTITTEDTGAGSVTGTLSGTQEVPPSGSAGTGSVTGDYNAADGSLTLNITYSGLEGETAAAHIHNGAAGTNGGVIYPLSITTGVTAGSFSETVTLSADEASALLAGNLYVNVHTTAVPSGELRAQLGVANCASTFTRTFTATDDCGNTATATQTITGSDDEAPTFTFVPADAESPCIDDNGNITVYAQVCSSSDDAEEDESNGDEGDMNLTSSDLELALDNSQNKNVKVGVRFKDLNIPDGAVITSAYIQFSADATIDVDPSELRIYGEDSDNALTFTNEDFNISDRPQTDADVTWNPGDWLEIGDNLEVERTPDLTSIVQEVVDRPGFTRESAIVFVLEGFGKRTAIAYDLNPMQAPELYVTYAAADLLGTATATDNCGAVNVTFEDTSAGDCDGSATRTFTATDACGNTATAIQTINFTGDNVPPVFTFVPASIRSDCDFQAFPPTFGTPVAEDNCSDVTITFEDYFYEGDEESCDDEVDYEYRREWTATDACGNTTTAVQNYDVNGNDYSSFTGFIYTEEEAPVDDVQVTLEGFNGFSAMSISGGNGTYGYNSLTAGANYSVTPYHNEDPLNGVSSYDLVLISKHILEMQLLDSPYKLIAADINRSGSITTFDLVELRKMILHIDDNFSNNTSWRFIEDNYSFPQPNNPFVTIFPEETFINGLVMGEEQNYIAVKVGDVNSSAVANSFTASAENRTTNDLTFVAEEASLKVGDTYEMTVRAADFNNVSAYQFTMNFDANQLEFVGMTPAELSGLNESNFGFAKVNEGAITTSWNNNKGLSMDANAALFTLTFKAKEAVTVSDALSINSRYTKAAAYNDAAQVMDVKLRFEGEAATVSNNGFALYQNQPNPFKSNTTIAFELPEDAAATLSIHDVSGRLLKQIEGNFVKGYNEVSLSKSDLQATGVVYYRLVTAEFEATKKMMIVK